MLRIWIFVACIAGLYALGHTRVEDVPDASGPDATDAPASAASLSQTRVAAPIPAPSAWQVALPVTDETLSGFGADPVHARPATLHGQPRLTARADLAARDDARNATASLARPPVPR